jgi:hypothetical protein
MFAMLVPITALLVSPVIVYLALRHARERREILSRERLAAIEKGLDVLEPPMLERRSSPLYSGIVMVLGGAALTLAMRIMMGFHSPWGFGLVVVFVGLGKMVHWFVGGREEWKQEKELDEELRRAYIDRLRRTGITRTGDKTDAA